MCSAATVADDHPESNDGLSLLDIVRHAVATITHTLNQQDRLSIVAYSTAAQVLCELTSMTDSACHTLAATFHVAHCTSRVVGTMPRVTSV
jgi:hypothetical protein